MASRRPSTTRAARGASDADDPLVGQLVELGLTLAQSRVYLTLLAASPEKASNVALRAGVSRTTIYEILQNLESFGFAVSEGIGRAIYRAVDPAIAIPQWLQTRDRRRLLERENDEALGNRLVETLPFTESEEAPEEAEQPFEPVIGEERSSAVLPQLARRAKHSLDIMQMPPFVQPRKEWNVAEAEALTRGVRVRILNDDAALDERPRVKEALVLGAEVRVEPRHPLKVILRDGEEAAIALRHAPRRRSDISTLLIRQPDLVRTLAEIFERQWSAARPVAAEELT
jgi:HTH-type transcriptional regulator, sugar sensing transcriptional regulator